MKDNRTPVVFRVHSGTGKVIALFPEDEIQPGHCVSFVINPKPEVVQETTRYRTMIEMSRPATTGELQPLLAEIRKMGFAPVVRQKYRRKK